MKNREPKLLLAFVCALALASTAARPVAVDQVWTNRDIAHVPLRLVAVLPAATLTGDPSVSQYVAARWRTFFPDPGFDWIPANATRENLRSARVAKGSLLDATLEQVERDGQTDEATSRAASRLLGADALMLLRVDRWERQIGTRDMIYVDLTATLVDSTGTRLWRSAGRCHIESRAIRGDVILPEASPGVRTERVSAPAGSPGAAPSGGTNSPGASSGGNLSGGSTGFFKDKLVRDGLRQTPMPSPPSVAESQEAAVPSDFRAAVDSLLAAWVPRFPARPRPADRR